MDSSRRFTDAGCSSHVEKMKLQWHSTESIKLGACFKVSDGVAPGWSSEALGPSSAGQ